ncbi:hypothetical protein DFH07DRAFT_353250 [Mycena maculata]|uniref:Uncharacterized protein n=1 Tax=Mycena maculata TaxID=230809 RepID=A0AAD7JJY5_9AGAR|nr:hypothetical protein DFH07DRAFT_353250 [Mycena maculata]
MFSATVTATVAENIYVRSSSPWRSPLLVPHVSSYSLPRTAMFLQANAYPFTLGPAPAFPTNAWLSPLHLPLALLASLAIFALLPAFLAARPLAEKRDSSWFPLQVTTETLPMLSPTAAKTPPVAAPIAHPRIGPLLPSVYKSQKPISMAKIIMARHMHRRPASAPLLAPSRAGLEPPRPAAAPAVQGHAWMG